MKCLFYQNNFFIWTFIWSDIYSCICNYSFTSVKHYYVKCFFFFRGGGQFCKIFSINFVKFCSFYLVHLFAFIYDQSFVFCYSYVKKIFGEINEQFSIICLKRKTHELLYFSYGEFNTSLSS